MECKFCKAEIAEDVQFCPNCGKSLEEEQVTAPVEEEPIPAAPEQEEQLPAEEAVQPAEEELAARPAEEETPAAEEEVAPQPEQKPKKKVWVWVVGIVGAVLALCVLALVLLTAFGVKLEPKPNDIFKKDSYSVSLEQANKKSEDVVATIGGRELTNRELRLYYRLQMQDFLSYYGSYLSAMNLDLEKPLSEQVSYFDQTMNWEQFLLDVALQTWQNYQALALLAEDSGFELSAEYLEQIESMPKLMDEQAVANGYESAQSMLEEAYGKGVTLEDYLEYFRLYALCSSFYSDQYEKMIPTREEAEMYFAENEDEFADSGIVAGGGLQSSVRHILVCPTGGTEDENGTITYSDEEWAQCLEKAEAILQEWKDGEATEDSFAALVPTYTEDTGSSTTGGLYTGINPTSSYVQNFLDWAVDTSRQAGDTGIVQTEYGYHIMYFVEGDAFWLVAAEAELLNKRITEMTEGAEKRWPMEVDYSKIVLPDLLEELEEETAAATTQPTVATTAATEG